MRPWAPNLTVRDRPLGRRARPDAALARRVRARRHHLGDHLRGVHRGAARAGPASRTCPAARSSPTPGATWPRASASTATSAWARTCRRPSLTDPLAIHTTLKAELATGRILTMMLLREGKILVTGAPGLPDPYPAEVAGRPAAAADLQQPGPARRAGRPALGGRGRRAGSTRACPTLNGPEGITLTTSRDGRRPAPGGDVPRLHVRPGDGRPGAGAGLHGPGRTDHGHAIAAMHGLAPGRYCPPAGRAHPFICSAKPLMFGEAAAV